MMQLEAFRVQNYKKIQDTGWVSCRDLTVFVGKNESGKSAIFRGLSKLNPSDGEKYDDLKEFPRRRYTAEYGSQDWPAATGRFLLGDDERQELVALCPFLEEVQRVEATRHYSWALTVQFDPGPEVPSVSLGEFRDAIDRVTRDVQELAAPEGYGEALGEIKQAVLQELQQAKEKAEGDGGPTKAQADGAVNAVATQANEEWQKELLDPVACSLRELADRAGAQEKLGAAHNWVEERLPSFVYFDRYDILDSDIHIPTFLQALQDERREPKHRVTLCLFKHVGLDLQEMLRLGSYDRDAKLDQEVRRRLDELSIRASSASIWMTDRFRDWWEQRRHKFNYDFQGEYFRVWVADDLDPSPIELDQRSRGLQYFFSFYLVFLVEAEEAHAGSILLLDEPGLHVHGTAQAKVVEFLEKLSVENQTLYSTHSPFMVDVGHLERARAVYEDDDGTTRVSEDVWPRDKDSLFPLQAALGYQLAQSLFVSKRQLVVEGLTDFWLLRALDAALAKKGRRQLRSDLVIVPSAGLSKLLPLASMLIGHDVEVVALLDGDEPARKEGKRLVDRLLAGEDGRCLFVGDFVDNRDAEIEDIFPEEEYLTAVKEAYPEITIRLAASENALSGVVNKVEALFDRKKLGRFEKWRPAAILRDRIVAQPESVADSTVDAVEKIFQAANSLFP